ncbi:MAG: chemotaxis protein CheX [Acidobacteria bacterium]|nr:chemotaxis protein CheX [Acidobacteriota bacterium]
MEREQIAETMIAATNDVFAMMLGVDVAVGAPGYDHRGSGPNRGVVALVGLAGTWAGTGTINCTPEQACWLASQMLGQEFPAVNEDVLDAVGEIANMVIGNIKTSLEEALGPIGLSVPTVVYGRNFATRSVGKQSWTVVEFGCGAGSVSVGVMISQVQPSGVPRVAAPALISV